MAYTTDRESPGLRCAVFRSTHVPNIYVVLPAQSDPNGIFEIVVRFGPLQRLKDLDITPGTNLVGASADEILRSIAQKGYHIQGAEVRVQVSEVSSAVAGGLLGAALGGGPIGALVGAALGAVIANQKNKKDANS